MERGRVKCYAMANFGPAFARQIAQGSRDDAMLWAILSGFVIATVAPWLTVRAGRWTGMLLAALPLGLFGWFCSLGRSLNGSGAFEEVWPWVPSLGVDLAFRLDGLSLLFGMMITGVGALIFIYSSGYMAVEKKLGRFYAYLLTFMASMLGAVLSDNLFGLFIFWELTSFSSYLLIGFKHEKESARASALQALLVTGGGGLAMMAGFVLLSMITGEVRISLMAEQHDAIVGHALFPLTLLLILAGAFTKSAQVPFHFWLPGAMEAPTPVSAYLHSSTMVKLGIFLMARMSPVIAGNDLWHWLVIPAGLITFIMGAVVALMQVDLKRILAYSTVSSLGLMTLLLGIGSEAAIKALVVYIVVHTLYKAALFMTAGSIDHETGTRSVLVLSGLWKKMPVSMLAALVVAASMAGVAPLFGFIGKELVYESLLRGPAGFLLITGGVIGSALTFTGAMIVTLLPFFGKAGDTPKHPHEAPVTMLLGPLLLAGLSIGFAIYPGMLSKIVLDPAAASIFSAPFHIHLHLWHGFNLVVALSGLTFALGLAGGIYAIRLRTQGRLGKLRDIPFTPTQAYQYVLKGLLWTARSQTRLLQHGYLRFYIVSVIATTLTLVVITLARVRNVQFIPLGIRIEEITVAGVLLASTYMVAKSRSRLATVTALGMIGLCIITVFILYGAPDLAMTQFSVEALSVILLVLVIYRLPPLKRYTPHKKRVRDGVLACAAGGVVTLLMLIVLGSQTESPLTDYFSRMSVPQGKGHNVVNVILVDFRGFDTLGEITVLAVAAIGVLALIKLRPDRPDSEHLLRLRNEAAVAEHFSLILTVTSRLLMPVLLLASVFITLRGHNEPGGGFIGGLLAAMAYSLVAIGFGVHHARQALRVAPLKIISAGLSVAALSGVVGTLFFGKPFMSSVWLPFEVPVLHKVGTPMIFDIGVFLVVLGITLLIIFSAAEEN